MSSTFQQITDLLGLGLTRERVRFWGIQSGLSVLDQGLTSGAGFLLNLFLARWLTNEDYGAFAVVFATLIFMSNFQNVLVLEPMTVFGPARYSAEMPAYLLAQLRVAALVLATVSGLMLLASGVMATLHTPHLLVAGTISCAVALPFLLLFWLVRRMCYVVRRPLVAVWASSAYLALMLVGMFLLHAEGWLNTGSAFLLIASVSVIAVLLPLHQLGLLGARGKDACPWKIVARENWNYGRWLMASAVLYPLSTQTQTYLAAAMIGLGAAGVLRAVQIPALVMTQIIVATSLLMLPPMAQEFGAGRLDRLRKKAVLATLALTIMALAYTAVLATSARLSERILFGGKFAAYAWLIPVLGLVPLFTAFGTGFSMALRAVQKPQCDLIANAVTAPVAVLTAAVFIKTWGISGAAFSLVTAAAAMAAVFFWFFVREDARSR